MNHALRLLFLISCLAAAGALGSNSAARQNDVPIDVFASADVIAHFTEEPVSSRRVELRVATFSLNPGQSTLTFATRGSTLIAIQSGTLLLIADRSVESARPLGDGTGGTNLSESAFSAATDGTGGSIEMNDPFLEIDQPRFFEIQSGFGAVIRAGTIIRLTTVGGDPVQVLLINLTPVQGNNGIAP